MKIFGIVLLAISLPSFAGSFEAGKNPLFYSNEDASRDVQVYCNKMNPRPKDSRLFSGKALDFIAAQEKNEFVSIRCIDDLITDLKKLDTGRPENAAYLSRLSDIRAKKKEYFANRIFWQDIIRKPNPEYVTKAYKTAETSCDAWTMTEDQSALRENMQRVRGLRRSCRDQLISSTAYGFIRLRNELKNFADKCREFPIDKCKEYDDYLALMKSNLRDLTSDVQSIYGLSESEVACLPSPETMNDPAELLSILKKARDVLMCAPLDPGKSNVVDSSEGIPTGVAPNYLLSRDADGSYTASLIIELKNSNNADLSLMDKKIRDCYAEASPYIKGPSGEQLRMKYLTPEEGEALAPATRPKSNLVWVTSESIRANSAEYPASAECGTIVHEGLHLLGLVDEYDGKTDGYDCRITPKASSIMSDSGGHYEHSIDKSYTCNCDEGNCREIFGGNDENLKIFEERMYDIIRVPSEMVDACDFDYDHSVHYTLEQIRGMTSDLPYIGRNGNHIEFFGHYSPEKDKTYWVYKMICSCKDGENCDEKAAEFRKKMKDSYYNRSSISCQSAATSESRKPITAPAGVNREYDGTSLIIFERAKEKSILAPAEFKRIISGNCPTSVPDFDKCANWAYRRKDPDKGCEGQPKECLSDAYYLGIGQ